MKMGQKVTTRLFFYVKGNIGLNFLISWQIENLHKDKEAIIAKFTQDNSHDGQRVRTLQRDNAQLHLKVKGKAWSMRMLLPASWVQQ